MILYSKKIKMKGFNNMTKLIIKLPSREVNKNDLAEIANKMQAIELSFNDLINDIPELKKFNNFEDYTIEANLSDQYDEFFIAGKMLQERWLYRTIRNFYQCPVADIPKAKLRTIMKSEGLYRATKNQVIQIIFIEKCRKKIKKKWSVENEK